VFFSWLKRRRRRKLLAESFPRAWEEHLDRNVGLYNRLPREDQRKLRDCLRIFVAEKHWVGCGGLELTDQIRVTIAAGACILLLGIDDYYFDHLKSVLVYPDAFVQPPEFQSPYGVVDEDRANSGEAWQRGPVILSWEDVLCDALDPGDGRNVVLHEFAHKIDGLDGEMGGTPPLHGAGAKQRWNRVIEREFQRLEDRVSRGKATLLDRYGASNRAEFFAVATECFFEQPVRLQRRHPALYDILRDFYCQHPAAWNA